MDKQLFTITIYSEHQVGLLNQISIIFTRRGLNIESITASASSIDGVHKVTITTWSDRVTMQKVIQQIEKRIDVLKAFLFTDDEIIYQEVALYKVTTSNLINSGNVEELMRRYNARILEITNEYTVIERTGHRSEIEALFEELKNYNLLQFVRSGRISVTKSTQELVTQFLEQQALRRAKQMI